MRYLLNAFVPQALFQVFYGYYSSILHSSLKYSLHTRKLRLIGLKHTQARSDYFRLRVEGESWSDPAPDGVATGARCRGGSRVPVSKAVKVSVRLHLWLPNHLFLSTSILELSRSIPVREEIFGTCWPFHLASLVQTFHLSYHFLQTHCLEEISLGNKFTTNFP